jgi:hypothetical protein
MDHGRRLTQREYEQAIVALYTSQPSALEPDAVARVRRRELDLTIDHRLGTEFPSDRRDALWQIQQRIERKRLRLLASWLASLAVPRLIDKRANQVAQFVLDEYAQVLTPEEMRAYFGDATCDQ